MPCRLAMSLAVTILLVPPAVAEVRLWTDSTGQFTIRAEFLKYADNNVTLRREDGKEITLPMLKLSRADQKYIRDELRRRRDERSGTASASSPAVNAPSAADTDWSGWRGPQRNGLSPETGLLQEWTGEGPDIVWQARGLGRGYASVAVAGGKVYTLGARNGGEHLIALDEATSRELWATRIGGADHSNSTPVVEGDLVFALGLEGDLVCASADDGREIWRKNYARDFGGRMMSSWGYSESPLVDGDFLICTPGGERAMMAALEKRTGKVVWTTPMPRGAGPKGQDGAGYSSPVVSEAAGVRQYVQLVGRGVIGVAAKDGTLLWGYNRMANGTANVPTPIVHGDYVFCSSGYDDGGSALLKLSRSGGGVSVQEVYYTDSRRLQNHHGGMLLVGDHLYLGHGHNKGLPVCIEMATGKVKWGPLRGPGSGSAAVAYADGHLYFRYEDGTMALIEASPQEYRLKGTFRIASRNDKSWPHPVISGGRLYLRDQDELHAYDISSRDAG